MRLPFPDWLLLLFFVYAAVLRRDRGGLLWLAAAAVSLLILYAIRTRFPRAGAVTCDYLRFGLVIAAYRSMNWFTVPGRVREFENAWIGLDRSILSWLRPAIESTGLLMPGYLELCYALVYAVGPACMVILHLVRPGEARRWTTWYLAGTLSAYALFPFFPSDPPRVVFPGQDLPGVVTALRRFNLWLVQGYGIHSSVFPSAHVSSALSGAFGLLAALPDRKRYGISFVVYALSVAVATLYGRYHFAVDAAAGLAIPLVLAPCLLLAWRDPAQRAAGKGGS